MKRQRYLIYVSNSGFKPLDRKTLQSQFRVCSPHSLRLIDVRVGSRHIEFDVLADVDALNWAVRYLDNIFGVNEVREVVRADENMIPEEIVGAAVRLFNSEKFWEAHELLEGLWRRLAGREKEVIHAVILMAAAHVHLQKDEREVFTSMILRAKETLSAFEGVVFGLEVNSLRRGCDSAVCGLNIKLETVVT
ncbi:MAG: DUF309 domain-containing protein [Nitrososphaerota archaeon]